MRGTRAKRPFAGLAMLGACIGAALFIVPTAFGSGNAGYTTFDELLGGCVHGSPNGVNCNSYDSKDHVYMSGGPTGGNGLADGSYYFAVLTPGSQNGGFVDGASGNLSDVTVGGTTGDLGSGDDVSNRTFTVTSGLISANGGTHADGFAPLGNPIIGLAPFDDTANPGGVYILAICTVGATSPSDCKYDAFKVEPATPCTGDDCDTGIAADPTISKDAAGAYNTTWTWGITKSACAHGVTPCTQSVDSLGSTVTFDYTVKVTHDAGTNSDIKVTGTIVVTNPNADDVVIDGVTDQLSSSQVCTVTNGGPQTVAGNSSTDTSGAGAITYVCTIVGTTVPTDKLFNTATVSWSGQVLDNGDVLVGSSASFTYPTDPTGDGIAFTQTKSGNCITVTDAFNASSPGTLGSFCADGTHGTLSSSPAVTASYTAPTWTLTYSRSVSVVVNRCTSYSNTATFSGAGLTSGLKQSDSATVTVCGRVAGGLTIGFWQNKNGQSIITSYSGTNCQALATWLQQFNPFKDLTATSCGTSAGLTNKTATQATGVAGYVYNIIKAATCTSTTSTCNSMLKAQMLATALNVYFSDPSFGGNRIGAPAPVGGVKVDLIHICKMIDGSGGTATCSGAAQNTASAFGGGTCQTVLALLQWSNASQIPNYAWGTTFVSNSGGLSWYGQVKATQVLAKDTFDAINNQVAFSC
jgi:hypothetical protein